jgi:DHA1 family multidrug resistance protein-like MFS transporter
MGSVLGFLQTSVVGGNLIGPLIGGELSQRYGYRATFTITAGALVVAGLLVILFVRERHAPPMAHERRSVSANVRELMQLPALRWMLVCVICGHSALMLINPQISLFVSDLAHDPAHLNRWVGLVVAAPAFSSFLAATWWGRAGDHRGHAGVLSMALAGAAICTLPATFANALWQLLAIRFCLGGFTAALTPSTHSVVAHSVPEHRTAGAFSLLSSAQMMGACLGPFASGPLAGSFGVRPLFPVTSLLLLIAAFAAFRAAAAQKEAVPVEPP